jgi:heptaprenyl diphosphate synthase
MNNYWQKYPKLNLTLQDIEAKIEKYNRTGSDRLNASFDHLLSTKGKLLRPALVLTGAMFNDHDEEDKLKHVATAIETLHMASLIHDDIIDDSDFRRGKKSIQAKYSKPYAVFMGDYLLTQVFSMLAEYDYTRENLKDISKAVSRMCLAEMLQHHLKFKTDVSTRDYLKVVTGKTAGLFAVSLGIGAHIAGCEDKLSKELARIGYNIGMAFQIQDDLLDYTGDVKEVGKDLLADLKNGYYTLPVIYALKGEDGKALKHMLNKKHRMPVKKAITLIKSHDSIEKTQALAEKYTQRAIRKVSNLPDCHGKLILDNLVNDLLKRTK